jgi:hypothetical protein
MERRVDEKYEQRCSHRRRRLATKYNSCQFRPFRIFERHSVCLRQRDSFHPNCRVLLHHPPILWQVILLGRVGDSKFPLRLLRIALILCADCGKGARCIPMESVGVGRASGVSPSCNLSFFSFLWFWPLQAVDSPSLRLPQQPLPSWNG